MISAIMISTFDDDIFGFGAEQDVYFRVLPAKMTKRSTTDPDDR